MHYIQLVLLLCIDTDSHSGHISQTSLCSIDCLGLHYGHLEVYQNSQKHQWDYRQHTKRSKHTSAFGFGNT